MTSLIRNNIVLAAKTVEIEVKAIYRPKTYINISSILNLLANIPKKYQVYASLLKPLQVTTNNVHYYLSDFDIYYSH